MAVKCNLKKIRTQRHLLQEDIANGVSTDANTICRYENGARCPSIEMALRLSAFLNLGVNQIFELDQYKDPLQHSKERQDD